jgi:hypothetical protein
LTLQVLPDNSGGQVATAASPKATANKSTAATPAVAAAGVAKKGVPTPEQRAEIGEAIKHFAAMKVALEKYKTETGSFPKTDEKMIAVSAALAVLAPKHVADTRLPLRTLGAQESFIYRSDGADYKLIMHGARFCEPARHVASNMVDPNRNWPKDDTCEGIGHWTANAAKW